MEKVTGVVESKSRKGNSIKVGGDWYSCFKAEDLNHIEWKDEVEFLYEQSGEFKNIKGQVAKISSGGIRPAHGAAKSGGGYNSIGVELGHAANLAMRMMEQGFVVEAGKDAVGSTEYFSQFTQHTVDMYKVMKAIRAKVESADGDKSEAKTASKPASDDADLSDLF